MLIKETLGCGYIKPNHKNRLNDNSEVLVVRNRNDLLTKVIPFFKANPIISSKQKDFETFAEIVYSMEKGDHLIRKSLINLIKKAFATNGGGKYRKWNIEIITASLESSETICQNPATAG
ncbi:hypothetical protein AUK11_01490 [bacterium CG2_30_37_16]|nr:MAG: hypothetical protein AUK11_01490 [bacterium CG2_30_37_16]